MLAYQSINVRVTSRHDFDQKFEIEVQPQWDVERLKKEVRLKWGVPVMCQRLSHLQHADDIEGKPLENTVFFKSLLPSEAHEEEDGEEEEHADVLFCDMVMSVVLDEVIRDLASDDPSVVEAAEKALDEECVAEVALKDEDLEKRLLAVATLTRVAKKNGTAEYVRRMVVPLEDSEKSVRWAAALALAEVAALGSPIVISTLGELLEDETEYVRRAGLLALTQLKVPHQHVIAVVRERLLHPERRVRCEAVLALTHVVERNHMPSVEAVCILLEDRKKSVREAAVVALAQVADSSSDFVTNVLLAKLSHHNPETRIFVLRSLAILAQKGNGRAIHAVNLRMMTDPDHGVRVAARGAMPNILGDKSGFARSSTRARPGTAPGGRMMIRG
eukprot:gnl/TRDRNA2_/TRDRNA2_157320_c2_seq2.p1 gnl/TRDRNA2_/TRDRNA2_157320_c2~~gnl/TRDRNA2_/TRDRNA2_157320_c2_seq2.p1  ORF type:complete len:388 (+),score=66.72 gnl/TRDRNA2_/TRDRNA2_157320_c2_seq2:83-1246(+)